jgi:hypothetical protein
MRGSKNANYAMQLDLLAGVADRVAILLDSDAPDADILDIDSLKTKVSRGFIESDLAASGRNPIFSVATHPEFDIMFYFDGEIVREILGESSSRAPHRFTRMSSAWSTFQHRVDSSEATTPDGRPWRLTMKDFKAFLFSEYGLKVTPWIAKEIVRRQYEQGIIPQRLFDVIEGLCSPLTGDFLLES